MAQNGLKVIGKCVLILAAGVLAGTMLLTLAYMVPVDPEKRDIAYEQLESEGWYPRASVHAASLDTYFTSYYPDVLDGSTDKIMVQTALDTGSGVPLVRAMNAHSEFVGDYSYYWHGYVVLLRPLFLLFDVAGVRSLNGMCQLFLIVALAVWIGREKGARYVCMFITSYVLLMPQAVSMCFQYSWVFYIGFAGTFVLLAYRQFFAERWRYVYLFLALGMLTAYFDLLTFPLLTWGIPLVWWLVTEEGEEKVSYWVRHVVCSGFGWIAGYAFFWMMKWGLATVILGRNVFAQAWNEVFYRSGTREIDTYGFLDRWNAAYVNWRHYEYGVFALVLAAWLLWWICRIVRQGGWHGSSRRYAYFLTGLSSPLWYYVLVNHTEGHHLFTYRIWSVTILAFLALMLDCSGGGRYWKPDRNESGGCRNIGWGSGEGAACDTDDGRGASVRSESRTQEKPEGKRDGGRRDQRLRKKRLRVCCLLGGCAVLALFPPLLAREELQELNGEAMFRQVELVQESRVEAVFVPSFDRIRRFGLGLECSGTEGEYVITLWEEDQEKYQMRVPAAEGQGKNYQWQNVDWKLERGKEYRLTAEGVRTREPVYVWVTEEDGPMAEYRELYVNGEGMGGQPLTGVTYWCRPLSGKRMLFLAASWFGVFAALCSVFLSVDTGEKGRQNRLKSPLARRCR